MIESEEILKLKKILKRDYFYDVVRRVRNMNPRTDELESCFVEIVKEDMKKYGESRKESAAKSRSAPVTLFT